MAVNSPPRLARWLLERRLSGPTKTFFLGDLEERFVAMAHARPFRARLWYWRQCALAMVLPMPGVLGVGDGGPALLGSDLRQAVRGIVRNPIQTALAVVPLGLGIGVVATAFSIVWGTVLAGLPFENAHELVHFERARLAEGQESLAVTPHDYLDWKSQQSSFEDLGAYVEREIALPTDGGPPERRSGVEISANSFPLLRLDAALGRTFTVSDEQPGSPEVILLSHRLWTSRFGADPGMVGRTVVVDGSPATVVGVMAEGVGFPIAEEFWVPLRIDLSQLERGDGRLDVFGRLLPGATIEMARSEFDGITAGIAAEYPGSNDGISASLRTFSEEYVGPDFTATVFRLLAGALLVLVVCCANVANLLLIRGLRRRRDFVVRRALGATPGALIRQLTVEAGLLAVGGAALGIWVAGLGTGWFNRVGTGARVFDLPHGSDSLFWWDVGINLPMVAVVIVCAGMTAVLSGLIPAFTVAGASELTRRGGGGKGPKGGRLQRGIVLSQLALTAGLLVAAGFVVRSVENVSGVADRFVVDDVTVMALSLRSGLQTDPGLAADPATQVRFVQDLAESMAADPAVQSVAFATSVPLEAPRRVPFTLDGVDEGVGDQPETAVISVSPAYFDVFGVQSEQGRVLNNTDQSGGSPVAVVNRRFVERYLGGRDPIGALVRLGQPEDADPWVEVVGVVPTLWERPGAPDEEAGVYLPLGQVEMGDPMTRVGRWGLAYPRLAVKGVGGSPLTARRLSEVVYDVNPSVLVRRAESMVTLSESRLGRYRVWGQFWLGFAVAALLLAALGIYGVLSYSVTLRTSEIGVRRALGASAESIQRDVVLRALRDVGVGLVAGLVLGAVLTDAIRSVLYGINPRDPAVFAWVAVLVSVVAVVASWWPARRAARIDPTDAMRVE